MIGRWLCRNIIEEHYSILDLGCGRGVWEEQAKVKDFFGVDINPNHNPKYYNMKHYNIDEKGLHHATNVFTLVIAKDIIEHLNNPEKVLKEIHRVLVKGGTLIVKVPDYRSKNVWEDYTHKKPYTKNSIQNILKDNGFRVKRVVRLGGHFLPTIIPQPFSWLVVAKK